MRVRLREIMVGRVERFCGGLHRPGNGLLVAAADADTDKPKGKFFCKLFYFVRFQ